jgi:hypothetical protein
MTSAAPDVAETGNHTIRHIVLATGMVTTVAGSAGLVDHADAPAALLRSPQGVTVVVVGACPPVRCLDSLTRQ